MMISFDCHVNFVTPERTLWNSSWCINKVFLFVFHNKCCNRRMVTHLLCYKVSGTIFVLEVTEKLLAQNWIVWFRSVETLLRSNSQIANYPLSYCDDSLFRIGFLLQTSKKIKKWLFGRWWKKMQTLQRHQLAKHIHC